MLSHIFAELPNGIIREIVQYTGVTLKNRNGKYMVQIPKDDPRYHILSQIPIKEIHSSPGYAPDFATCVTLTRQDNPDNYIYFDVCAYQVNTEQISGSAVHGNDLKNKYYINYNLSVFDKKNKNNRRNYYYRY